MGCGMQREIEGRGCGAGDERDAVRNGRMRGVGDEDGKKGGKELLRGEAGVSGGEGRDAEDRVRGTCDGMLRCKGWV